MSSEINLYTNKEAAQRVLTDIKNLYTAITTDQSLKNERYLNSYINTIYYYATDGKKDEFNINTGYIDSRIIKSIINQKQEIEEINQFYLKHGTNPTNQLTSPIWNNLNNSSTAGGGKSKKSRKSHRKQTKKTRKHRKSKSHRK